ncbi:hypothetical protein GDO86_015512 [Hymenochirus boettgeri]|uniref:glutaminyl-peptide cyclotransferase n=2 Tax=Hymenochirus boettgeri TaxID=247094 RepID=A0A8T2K1K4_9PIPI|nr:hypothetical protein GDO86_015512 [Hymenochirus boettgeri]
MAPRRSGRDFRAHGGNVVIVPRTPKYRSLLVVGVGLFIGAGILLWENNVIGGNERVSGRRDARSSGEIVPKALSVSLIRQIASEVNVERLWTSFLRPMLIERPPGSDGNRLVRELISSHLQSLSSGWTVDLDLFHAATPRGYLSFGNVVATLDPSAPHRLVLACHIDSKWFLPDSKGRTFIGATDSAVPCSLILEAVTALDTRLQKLKDRGSTTTLQLLFLDGEEALAEWSQTDSLYGARHLAQHLENTKLPGGGNQLNAIAFPFYILFPLHFQMSGIHMMTLRRILTIQLSVTCVILLSLF